MTSRRDPAFERQLLAGTTALMLVATLAPGHKLHAYEIAARMAQTADVAPKLSTLYPQLRGLEAKGFLKSQLQASDKGPARRVYGLTPAGRQAFESWKDSWHSIARRVDALLEAAA